MLFNRPSDSLGHYLFEKSKYSIKEGFFWPPHRINTVKFPTSGVVIVNHPVTDTPDEPSGSQDLRCCQCHPLLFEREEKGK